MVEEFSELRFDVPLPIGAPDPRRFEQTWRLVLASQRLTALATPPAETIAAHFRLCGDESESLTRYLKARLAALPGHPSVTVDSSDASSDWKGVRVWLSYRTADLTTLLQNSKQRSRRKHSQFPASRKHDA